MTNERAVIGGNNPPSAIEQKQLAYDAIHANFVQEFDELTELIDGLLDGGTELSDQNSAQIDELKARSVDYNKRVSAQHKLEKQPHIEAGKIVQKKYINDLQKPMKMRIDAMNEKQTAKKLEQDRLRKEAAAKAFREAEELRRKAELAAQSSHADIDAKLEAKALSEQAEAVHSEARAINNAPTGLRSKKVAHVHNHEYLYLWICEHDRSWIIDQLEQYAQRNIHNQKMDGVEIKTERVAA